MTPVVLIGLIAIGLISEGAQRVSERNTAEDAMIATLFEVSEAAASVALGPERPRIDAADTAEKRLFAALQRLFQDVDGSHLGLEQSTGADAYLLQATILKDFLHDRTESGDRGPSTSVIDLPPPVGSSAGHAVGLAEFSEEISRSSRALAVELVAVRAQRMVAELWYLAALVTVSFCVAAAILYWRAKGLQRRLQYLPDHLQQMVDEDASCATSLDRNAPEDVIADVQTRLHDFALKIRARLRENEKMERMAFTDPLTGLPNRRGLLAFLDLLAENEEVWADDNKIGLIHIDLDHFKTINDTLGHDAGDTVLREATKRMSTAIRDSDLLARLGGDEFLVVATGIEFEADVTRIADRLIEQFEAPILYEQRACAVGISMGMVLGGQRGRVRDPKRLLINADMALFKAKSEGRGRYAVFTSAMAEEVRRRNERTIALGEALHEDAFHPWFQPMMDRSSGGIAGLELLARWHDPERGVLMPDEFLDDAEASSLMEDIGLQVLAQALKEVRAWRLSGAQVPRINMNVGRTQLLSANFVDRFSWALDEANVAASQFAIEVAEKDFTQRGGEVAFQNVRRLSRMGLQVVLDDFGAEHASLAILGALQARMVKCTPETIRRLVSGGGEADLVRVLSALNGAASEMNLTISAKAVETMEESDLFLRSGIVVQQGDQLAAVMNATDTGAFLIEHTQRDRVRQSKAS